MKSNPFSVLLLSLFILSACSPSRLLSSWKSDSLQEYTLDHVLVVGVAKDETKRRIYENTFTDSLVNSGIHAVASYSASPQAIKPDKKHLREVVQKTAAQSVLITHVVSENGAEFYQPTNVIVRTNNFHTGLYGYYPHLFNHVVHSGSYVNTTKVVLETSLYDVQTEARIWSARTESIDPVMTRKYYQQLIDLFLSDLEKKNLLQEGKNDISL